MQLFEHYLVGTAPYGKPFNVFQCESIRQWDGDVLFIVRF